MSRTDTDRINFLENRGTFEVECDSCDEYSIDHQIDNESFPSLRESIDALMNAEATQSTPESQNKQESTPLEEQ